LIVLQPRTTSPSFERGRSRNAHHLGLDQGLSHYVEPLVGWSLRTQVGFGRTRARSPRPVSGGIQKALTSVPINAVFKPLQEPDGFIKVGTYEAPLAKVSSLDASHELV
jgi:hypothetical protein